MTETCHFHRRLFYRNKRGKAFCFNRLLLASCYSIYFIGLDYMQCRIKDADTRCLMLTGRKAISWIHLLFFLKQLMTFYHSRLADEPTDTIVSLKFLWFLSNVANSVETNVLHKTTPIFNYHILSYFLNCTHCITLMFKT